METWLIYWLLRVWISLVTTHNQSSQVCRMANTGIEELLPVTAHASLLQDLPSFEESLSSNALGKQTGEILAKNPELPGILITDQSDNLIAIIGRARFHELLAHRYSYAVFMRRPLSVLIEHLGNEFLQFYPHSQIDQVASEAVLRAEKYSRDPIAYRAANGRWRMVDTRILLMAAEAQRLTRQEIERERRHQAMLDWKSRSLARISHEIRTPLHGIIGALELIHSETDPSSIQIHIDSIRSCCQQLSQNLDETLESSESAHLLPGLKSEPCSITSIAEDIIESVAPIAASQGMECWTSTSTGVAREYILDARQVERALSKLTNIAIESTNKSTVAICISKVEGTEKRNDRILIQIISKDEELSPMKRLIIQTPSRASHSGEIKLPIDLDAQLALLQKSLSSMNGVIAQNLDSNNNALFSIELDAIVPPKIRTRSNLPLSARKFHVTTKHAARTADITNWLQGLGAIESSTLSESDFAIVDSELFDESLGYHRGLILTPFGETREITKDPSFIIATRPIKRGQMQEMIERLLSATAQGRSNKPADVHGSHLDNEEPLNILIVDDNDVNIAVLSRQTERMGHKTWKAKNGIEALAEISQRDFDLIIMDCHMPVLDGWQATEAIRARESQDDKLFIFGLTASSLESDHRRCLEVGMNGVATKPFNGEDLKELLRDALQRRERKSTPAA